MFHQKTHKLAIKRASFDDYTYLLIPLFIRNGGSRLIDVFCRKLATFSCGRFYFHFFPMILHEKKCILNRCEFLTQKIRYFPMLYIYILQNERFKEPEASATFSYLHTAGLVFCFVL